MLAMRRVRIGHDPGTMWILTEQVATSGKVVGIVSFPLGIQGEKVPLLARDRLIGRVPALATSTSSGQTSTSSVVGQDYWPGIGPILAKPPGSLDSAVKV